MDNQIKEIAERLQGLRDVLELSSAEFAQQAGLDQQEYEKAETGESDISVSMLQRISRKFRVSLDELMFRS
ncbi:MAG: helix-turn-helix transcriptional regulator, partial [Bacteroidaceae bacterium]|nr:helix-turn-helix transcriptional regulator [Bacteroidaceae bacterium]